MRTKLTLIGAACALLACMLPAPTPEPTATVAVTATETPTTPITPTATSLHILSTPYCGDTPTPVVIVVTATPTPTPVSTAMDIADFCEVPPIEFFALGLLNVHGEDIKVVPQFGVPCDGGIMAVPFEKPRDSGKWHVGVFGAEGGNWPLLDTITVGTLTPTPAPGATPGAGREARVNVASSSGDALDGGVQRRTVRGHFQ